MFSLSRVTAYLISQRCFNECILLLVCFFCSIAYIVPLISIANSYSTQQRSRNSRSQIVHSSTFTVLEAPVSSVAHSGSFGICLNFFTPLIQLVNGYGVFCQYSWSYLELVWKCAKQQYSCIRLFTHSFLHRIIEKMVIEYKLQDCVFKDVYPNKEIKIVRELE